MHLAKLTSFVNHRNPLVKHTRGQMNLTRCEVDNGATSEDPQRKHPGHGASASPPPGEYAEIRKRCPGIWD